MRSPTTPTPNKEGPFLPRLKDGGILARFGEGRLAFTVIKPRAVRIRSSFQKQRDV